MPGALLIPGRGPDPPNKIGPGPGKAWLCAGCADEVVPGPAGREGDHFGHPKVGGPLAGTLTL